MLSAIKSLFDSSRRKIKTTDEELRAIRDLEPLMKEKTFEEMQERVTEMRKELQKLVSAVPEETKRSLSKVNRREQFPSYEKAIQDKLVEFMPEVYAMVNESYRRVAGKPYYDVQFRAGILLGKGQILVEQYTGEGKTQTFQLPLALYALVGRGAHLVTVNNYLTKVGAEYAGHMLSKIGITVGVVSPDGSFKFIPDEQLESYKGEEAVAARQEQSIDIDRMNGVNLVSCTKQDAYNCDITYATNNELGFDYLRDNMVWDIEKMAQRELYFCIIDEADSILIDEARTPLIISATPTDADTEKYTRFAQAVKTLDEGEDQDYVVDYKSRSVNLTEKGMQRVEENLDIANAWDDYSTAFHIENALKAKALFQKDDQYMIRNGNVYIVDEFTGRVLEGRRYSEGLHQAIEAKEGVDIQQESKTFATITFQNFFRLYKVLCGGSGTVMTESEEFFKIYGLDSVVIPTNKPRIREDLTDRIFKTQEAKFKSVVQEVKEMHEIGRPVLIGTTSVEKSELVSQLLDKEGIAHEVLNAKFHEHESQIVSKAGKKGAVTVATNMAGRGTDIVIGGGSRGDAAYQEIWELGGLHVIGTERHDSRRIDNQLRGRTGRQGEPGSTRFYAAMDDQIMRVLGGEILARLMNMIRVPDDMPIEMGMISKQIETAQKRVEGINFDSRKRVVEYDDVMNQHREIFYTRRRSILETAENALGKVRDEQNRVIDTKLPEHQEKVHEYADVIQRQKESLEEMIEDQVLDQTERAVFGLIPEGTAVKDTDITSVLNALDNFVPKERLYRELGITENNAPESLMQRITDGADPQELFIETVRHLFVAKTEELGDDYYTIAKMISLESLDKKWVDHLEIMKGVRDSISLQGYAQRNPLIEYKNAAFGMFESFINGINQEIVAKLLSVTKTTRQQTQVVRNVQTNTDQIEDVLTGDREMFAGQKEGESAHKVVNAIQKRAQRQQDRLRTNAKEQGNKTITNDLKKYGRNDRVTVEYTDGTREENVKFKKVEAEVKSGNARIVT